MKSFDDFNFRTSLVNETKKIYEEELAEEPPSEPTAATALLRQLTEAGCELRFIRYKTRFYALLQQAVEQNRKAEARTPRDYRKSQFVGLRITRKAGRKHLADCHRLVSTIERYLATARVPGQPDANLRSNLDVLMFYRGLPRVLRRYAAFMGNLFERTLATNEVRAHRASLLTELIGHVREMTGAPQFSAIAKIILAWRDRHPFEADITGDVLRKQWSRGQAPPPSTDQSPAGGQRDTKNS